MRLLGAARSLTEVPSPTRCPVSAYRLRYAPVSMNQVSVTYPTDDRAFVTVERPATLNSLDIPTLRALADAAGEVAARPSLKVVVVRGRGRAFSSGLDLGLLGGGAGIDPRRVPESGREMVEAIDSIPAVTLAVLRGAVVGGGLVLASACDLRVAAEDTYFSIPEVDLGLPVGWGGVPRLVRELGPALTRELIMTCRPFTAREAKDAGFLNTVVPDADLDAAIDGLVGTLCGKPRYALLAVKRSVSEAAEQMVPAQGRTGEADVLAAAAGDVECRRAATDYLAGYRRLRRSE